MSKEAARAFRAAVHASEALQAKVEALGAPTPAALSALAQEHGHDVTAADIEALASDELELSDWEVELIAGGGSPFLPAGGVT